MASRMWTFWTGCGLAREGRHWLRELLALCKEANGDRVTGLWVDGCLAAVDGDHDHALRRAEECATLAAALRDPFGVAHARFVLGMAMLFGGQAEDAIPDLQVAVELERELPAPNPILPTSLLLLGMAGCLADSLDLARETLAEACVLAQASGEELVVSWARLYVGLLALFEGRQDEAVETLRGVLADHRSVGDVGAMGIAVELLAWAAMDVGDDLRAAELMGVSGGLAVAVAQLAGWQGLRSLHDAKVAELEQRLGSREFERAVKQGLRRPSSDAISFALEEATTSTQPLVHDDTGTLTARELEIALLVAQGQTNKQLASHLVISPRTAEGHVQSVLAKLGFTSRTQIAAAFARQAASPDSPDVRVL